MARRSRPARHLEPDPLDGGRHHLRISRPARWRRHRLWLVRAGHPPGAGRPLVVRRLDRPRLPPARLSRRPADDLRRGTTPGEWLLRVRNQDGERCLAGTLGLGRAAWLDELASPVRRGAEQRPAELPELTIDVAPVGQDLRPMPHEYRPEAMATYLDEKLQDADPRWRGPSALLHPGWIAAQMTPMLHHSYDYGPAIHTRTQAQHLAPALGEPAGHVRRPLRPGVRAQGRPLRGDRRGHARR